MNKVVVFVIMLLTFSMVTRTKGQESLIGEMDYEYLETLIGLAKENYPRLKIVQHREAMSKAAFHLSKLTYFDLVNVAYIYRPRNQVAMDSMNPFLFNGFQFTARASLGSLIQKPVTVRTARRTYQIAQLESTQFLTDLENDVKAAYYAYMQSISELKVKTQHSQDSKIMFERIREQFELGEVELEVYTSARSNLSSTYSTVMQAEVNHLLAKDRLESLIGMKLENINKG